MNSVQFVFLGEKSPYPFVNAMFQKRLQRAFADFDLNSEDYCTILPQQDYASYLNLNLFSIRSSAILLFIPSPAAYFLMQRWLQDFAYRISINADLFLIAVVSVSGIVLATISIQSLKAALSNPVHSLRSN